MKPLKWKRLGKGKYAAPAPDGHVVIVEKYCGQWILHYEGGYYIRPTTYSRLADAKAAAPGLWSVLLAGWEQRQAKESDKLRAEREQHTAEVVAACRMNDSRTVPPRGVCWSLWAEKRVGCTAADVRAMQHDDRAQELLSELLDLGFGPNDREPGWQALNRVLSEWVGEELRIVESAA